MATVDEIHEVWAILIANYGYYEREISGEKLARQLSVWEPLLADLPGDQLRAAALQHIGASKWFPALSELREYVLAMTAPQHASGVEAWGEVWDAIQSWSRYACNGNEPLPEFSNPIITRLVRSMGMIELQDSENAVADRARFIEAYEQLVKRDHDERALLPQVREVRDRLQAERVSAVHGLFAAVAGKLRPSGS
jgi:hypothetical protein